MRQLTIAADVYWRLPGPLNFIGRVARSAEQARMLYLNMPYGPLPWIWPAVQKGLHDGHIGDVVPLTISEGMDIGSQVGIQLGRSRVSAAELAGISAPSSTAILLIPGERAANANCSQFAAEFMEQVGRVHGNILLVVVLHEASQLKDDDSGSVQMIVFDGSITPDEMDVYVSLRMLERPGPGSTRLLRSLVSEFAGFDVDFAEQLIKLDASQILGIGIDSSPLLRLIDEERVRWHEGTWLNRTSSLINPDATHALHDLFLIEHGDITQKLDAGIRLRRRYWRACLRTLTPWLEERRRSVLEILMPQLRQIADPNNKMIQKKIGSQLEWVSPEELEYNDIAFRAKCKDINGDTEQTQLAIDVCRKAKSVRDDIAHMRMPKASMIVALITDMDRLIPQS